MPEPTYPLDRRLLEIIKELTGASITLTPAVHGADSDYEKIRQKVSLLAWDSMHKTTDVRPEKPEAEFKKFDRNTWKRIFGHANLKQGAKPMKASEHVLKQIALFVGYDSWDELIENIEEEHQRIVVEHNSPRLVKSCIETRDDSILVGDRLYVEWKKSEGGIAWMKVEEIRKGTFCVKSRDNCKLEIGDTFESNRFTLGSQLFLKHLMRREKPYGDYKGSGYVTKVEKI